MLIFSRWPNIFHVSCQSGKVRVIVPNFNHQQNRDQWRKQINEESRSQKMDEISHISFSSCLRMKSFECAVTLSTLLHSSSIGIFFFTTLALVKISYRYLQQERERIWSTVLHIDSPSVNVHATPFWMCTLKLKTKCNILRNSTNIR